MNLPQLFLHSARPVCKIDGVAAVCCYCEDIRSCKAVLLLQVTRVYGRLVKLWHLTDFQICGLFAHITF